MANAWHHRSDAISSFVALIGVGGALVGIPLLDPAAGTCGWLIRNRNIDIFQALLWQD